MKSWVEERKRDGGEERWGVGRKSLVGGWREDEKKSLGNGPATAPGLPEIRWSMLAPMSFSTPQQRQPQPSPARPPGWPHWLDRHHTPRNVTLLWLSSLSPDDAQRAAPHANGLDGLDGLDGLNSARAACHGREGQQRKRTDSRLSRALFPRRVYSRAGHCVFACQRASEPGPLWISATAGRRIFFFIDCPARFPDGADGAAHVTWTIT